MIDVAALSRWMDGAGIGAGAVADVRPLSGGTQNIIVRLRRGDEEFVLRRPPAHPRARANETMRREARVLAALSGTDVPHPALVAACDDEGVLGAAFYLMRPVEGFNPVSGLSPALAGSPDARHRLGLALVEGVAALHGVDHRAVGLDDFGKPDAYLERQLARWRQAFASYGDVAEWAGSSDFPAIDAVSAWLQATRPAEAPPAIVHGDYHLANVMVRHDAPALAAIVDWELATIGDPLVDMGWLLATWPDPDGTGGTLDIRPWAGFPTGDELVAHYAARSGRDVSAIGWYRVFAAWKLAIMLESTFVRACVGEADAAVASRLHARAVNLVQRAEGWIS